MKPEPLDFSNPLIARHEAARQVLRASDEERIPLVIYLRKFNIHVMHGPTESERRFGEESVLNALPESARLLSIQEEPTGELLRSTFNSRVPAVWLGDGEDWKSVLRPILARSELIISEFTFLSEGIHWELETCRALGKHHQTVLILPPWGGLVPCVDHLTPLDQFPRVIWADQLFTEHITENFAVRDLMKRINAIGDLPIDDRKKLYADGSMGKRMPISYEGVLSGYKARAQDWEIRTALLAGSDDASVINYYRFWDWFRVGSVLGVLIKDLQSISMEEAASDLASAYIEVLQGIAHRVVALDQEGSFLTAEMARKFADSLRPLIGMLPEGPGTRMLSRYADLTLERFGYSPPVNAEDGSQEVGDDS